MPSGRTGVSLLSVREFWSDISSRTALTYQIQTTQVRHEKHWKKAIIGSNFVLIFIELVGIQQRRKLTRSKGCHKFVNSMRSSTPIQSNPLLPHSFKLVPFPFYRSSFIISYRQPRKSIVEKEMAFACAPFSGRTRIQARCGGDASFLQSRPKLAFCVP